MGVEAEGETYYDGARDVLQGIEQEEGISCLLGGSFFGHDLLRRVWSGRKLGVVDCGD